MTKEEIKKEILRLLPTSTITEHKKDMVRILMPAMSDEVISHTYETLKIENEKMTKLNEKQNRIALKYQVMVENSNKTSK